jgi:hypothetical protein
LRLCDGTTPSDATHADHFLEIALPLGDAATRIVLVSTIQAVLAGFVWAQRTHIWSSRAPQMGL